MEIKFGSHKHLDAFSAHIPVCSCIENVTNKTCQLATILMSIFCLFVVAPAYTFAQAEKETKLPTFAKYRLGDFGPNIKRNGVYDLTFSPDGSKIAVRYQDQIVRVWDIKTQKQISELDGHENRVVDMQFLSDSKRLVTAAGIEEGAIVWDSVTGAALNLLPGGATKISIVSRKDSVDEIVLGQASQIVTYNSSTSKIEKEIKWGKARNSSQFTLRDFTRNGESRLIFSGKMGAKKKVGPRIIFIREKKRRTQWGTEADQLAQATFSHTESWIAACFRNDTTLYLHNLNGVEAKDVASFQKLQKHREPIQDFAFTPDDRYLISVSWDKHVRIWETFSGSELAVVKGHQEHVCSVTVSNDGHTIATGASGKTDCSVILWDLQEIISGQLDEVSTAPDKVWSNLSSENARLAYSTLYSLNDETLDLISDKITSFIGIASEETIKKLIRQLSAKRYVTRSAAQRQLHRIRPQIEKQLLAALENPESFEQKTRIKQLLASSSTVQNFTGNERLGIYRSILFLERSDSARAITLLNHLSQSGWGREITREARLALSRK